MDNLELAIQASQWMLRWADRLAIVILQAVNWSADMDIKRKKDGNNVICTVIRGA